MQVDGGCHCGQVRYQAEVDPKNVVLCHCTDCQTLSGSAFRVVALTREGSFRLIAGLLKEYVKTTDSGARRVQTFCPDCGTPIYSATTTDKPGVVGLRVGGIRQRDHLPPRDQLWFRSAQAWLADMPCLPRQPTQPSFDPGGGFAQPAGDRNTRV